MGSKERQGLSANPLDAARRTLRGVRDKIGGTELVRLSKEVKEEADLPQETGTVIEEEGVLSGGIRHYYSILAL